MEKIATYSISALQKRFLLDENRKEFFFLEKDNYKTLPKEPYRTETYGIGLYRKGKMKLKTGLITHVVKGPSIITMGPGVIRSWEQTTANPMSSLLFFTESFFLKSHANVFALKSFDFFEQNDCHVLRLDETSLKKIEAILGQIRNTLASSHVHESAIIRSYTSILIHEIDAMHQANNLRKANKVYSSTHLVDKFKVLLANEFIRQRSVSYYAAKLNLTPKHFSTAIKEQTGKTAGEWIDDMVILEAKVLLQEKELTIAQVSDTLNFNDQSTFGKFFKKNTQLSPLDYRKSLA